MGSKTPAGSGLAFWLARATAMASVAPLLWMTAVSSVAASTPSHGFSPKSRSIATTAGYWRSGFMPPFIRYIPKNTSPNPMSSCPNARHDSVLQSSCMRKPSANSSRVVLPMSKAIIWTVSVVPIEAPRITPMVCTSVIMPASTKPTSMTVVALLLWMLTVTRMPTMAAKRRFPVTIASTPRSR